LSIADEASFFSTAARLWWYNDALLAGSGDARRAATFDADLSVSTDDWAQAASVAAASATANSRGAFRTHEDLTVTDDTFAPPPRYNRFERRTVA
jgi:hypothetical protein